MLFHSLQFAIFFPVVYGLYLVLSHKLQNRMLLVGSYVFYSAWDWRYCSLLLISTLTDYFCGLALARTPDANARRRKLFVGISIVVNIGLLGVFKYYDFFATEFQGLMGAFGLSVQPYFLNVALPIGISFYTFQTISYTIDVYREGRSRPIQSSTFSLSSPCSPSLWPVPSNERRRCFLSWSTSAHRRPSSAGMAGDSW